MYLLFLLRNELLPFIDLSFRFSCSIDNDTQFEALIDSGADYNVFHADVAAYLGINLKKGSKRKISGIGGKVLTGYEHRITLRLKDFTYHAPVTFSADIPENTLAVLGNNGFFDRFVVTLNYQAKIITLTS